MSNQAIAERLKFIRAGEWDNSWLVFNDGSPDIFARRVIIEKSNSNGARRKIVRAIHIKDGHSIYTEIDPLKVDRVIH
jgi:hypothetical protein